jgi:pimeloyl-ACP methyl ester carboxylesterase
MDITRRVSTPWHGLRLRSWNHWLSAAVLLVVVSLPQASPPALAGASPNGEVAGLKAKFVNVHGIRTRYYEYGQGEPLVLIHGGGWNGGSSANNWSKNIPGLAKRFHVYAFDRLGSGMTDNPKNDDDYNYPGEVRFVYDFLQTMNLRQVHLVGHSAGGALSFFFAIAHPEMVKTLVMVADGPADPHFGKTKLDLFVENCLKEGKIPAWKCRPLGLAYRPEVAWDEEYWATDDYLRNLPKSLETASKLKAGAGEPLRTQQYQSWLKSQWDRARNDGVLQMPILMYRAKQDALDWQADDITSQMHQGLAMYDILSAKNVNVKMIVIDNAGHFMYREYPALFNQDIINFIDYWDHHPVEASTKTTR